MKKIVIVGAGPAGIFSAYTLIENISEDAQITVIERGHSINDRHCPLREGKIGYCVNCKPCCNIMHGFGGAGTFSDCKLSLTPYGVGGDIINYVSNEHAENLVKTVDATLSLFDDDWDKRTIIGKESEKITQIKNLCKYHNLDFTLCPTKHLGTDGTFNVMKNMYQYLKVKKVNFCFGTEVLDIRKDTAINKGYLISTKDTTLYADYVIVAPGRSGNAWCKNIAESLNIETKSRPIDIGVRVETKADNVSKLTDALYDMKISYTDKNGIKTRTFCTNPKGYVSEEHYDNSIAIVNGHSFANEKSENTNFAVLVTLPRTSDYLHKFIELNSKINNNKIIYQNFVDFEKQLRGHTKKNKTNDAVIPTLSTAVEGDITDILPGTVCTHIYDFLYKLNSVCNSNLTTSDTILYGIEAKFYSDVIIVDNNMQTSCHGIYMVGDGAGISRGIIQAASCGILAAENIINEVSINERSKKE